MSATEYYLKKGFTPVFKTTTLHGTGTATVWTPTTSTKIVLTQLIIATNLVGSTAFYFGNLAGTKIVQFNHGGSTTISTELLADAEIYDRTLVANSLAPGTDGIKITAIGFEIPLT